MPKTGKCSRPVTVLGEVLFPHPFKTAKSGYLLLCGECDRIGILDRGIGIRIKDMEL